MDTNIVKKRIIIFIDWYFPAFKAGGPVRSCINLVEMLKLDYEIFVFTSNKDHGSDNSIVHAEEINCWIDKEPNVHILYSENNNFDFIKKTIRLIKPDFIYLNSMWSLDFTIKPLLLFKNRDDFKIILAPRGMLHAGALQFKNIKKLVFLNFANVIGLFNKVHFHVTDNQEFKDVQNRIKTFYSLTNIKNITNISDIPSIEISKTPINKTKNSLRLIFISRISPKKNLNFILELLHKVDENTAVNFQIYGPMEDQNYVNKCKDLANSLPENIHVQFLEEIRFDEVNYKLIENHFFILPTHGENFGYAIFESFAAGRPVIISDQTPWHNLESKKAGFDIPLSNPEKFVEAIEYAASMDQTTFDEWCIGAHHFAKKFIQDSNLKEKYLKLFS
jgi:glycosyltransferase involved in cell wall biosynthesis